MLRGCVPITHLFATNLAVLLFLENPTVIALTFLWRIGLLRQVFRTKPAPVAYPAPTP